MSYPFGRSTVLVVLSLGAVLVSAPPMSAQTAVRSGHVHDGSHDHAAPATAAMAEHAPAEAPAGQAAFAAIARVVETLVADPDTDWSSVDIEALRQHLIDMDRVVMEAHVTVDALPDGARFQISGDGVVRDAIRRMTLAHARALDEMPDLSARAAETGDGATLEVRTADPSETSVARIRGLGYVGLLTLGSHHAPHHLMIARGQVPVGH